MPLWNEQFSVLWTFCVTWILPQFLKEYYGVQARSIWKKKRDDMSPSPHALPMPSPSPSRCPLPSFLPPLTHPLAPFHWLPPLRPAQLELITSFSNYGRASHHTLPAPSLSFLHNCIPNFLNCKISLWTIAPFRKYRMRSVDAKLTVWLFNS